MIKININFIFYFNIIYIFRINFNLLDFHILSYISSCIYHPYKPLERAIEDSY